MSTQADFTEDEWSAITEAPLQVMVTMFAAGEHGPISMIKESNAGAHALVQPGNHGSGSGLIAEIVPVAQGKEARHGVAHPKGHSITEVIDGCLAELAPAAAALAELGDEGKQVGTWLVDIGAAVAGAAKGVNDTERDTLAKIATAFGVSAPAI